MPNVGDTVTCTETGKQFVITSDGFSFNYARDSEGRIFSDEGVDIGERRMLLDRSKPFTGYISSDGKRLTGWKGNVLGHVTDSVTVPLSFGQRRDYTHGKNWTQYTIRDVHGGLWRGRGSPSVYIRLRAIKPVLPSTRRT